MGGDAGALSANSLRRMGGDAGAWEETEKIRFTEAWKEIGKENKKQKRNKKKIGKRNKK